ncbi:hypothetical protein STEG23_020522, partial [Scotinomys teguina]
MSKEKTGSTNRKEAGLTAALPCYLPRVLYSPRDVNATFGNQSFYNRYPEDPPGSADMVDYSNSQKPPVYDLENAIGIKKLSLPSSSDSLVNSEDAMLCECHGEHIWHKRILCSLQYFKTGSIS